MADVHQIAGGMDAMRLSVDEQDALRRQEKRATARGNLAAFLVEGAGGLEAVEADPTLALDVAGEFAELCDMLGLESAPDGQPGICRRPVCGNELAAGSSMRPRSYQRKGYCSLRCMRMAGLRNVEDVV